MKVRATDEWVESKFQYVEDQADGVPWIQKILGRDVWRCIILARIEMHRNVTIMT